MSAARYRIGTVARLAGLTTHAIRVWERRYGAAAPDRTPGGARLYTEEDVQRFKLIKQLLEHGYTTRAIANLDLSALTTLASPDGAPLAEPSAVVGEHDRAHAAVEALLDAVTEMNVDAAERALMRASNELAPRDLVTHVLAPALAEVGARWASGELCTASEHAASALLRTRLGQLLAAQVVGPGPPVICTTPSGEQHELGALLVAVLIAMHGRRAIFLGANLPAAQIAEAVRMTGANSVALSVVVLSAADARRELSKIRQALPNNIELLVGGRGTAKLKRLAPDIRLLSSTTELEAWLDRSPR